jgi:hypothetical protein
LLVIHEGAACPEFTRHESGVFAVLLSAGDFHDRLGAIWRKLFDRIDNRIAISRNRRNLKLGASPVSFAH